MEGGEKVSQRFINFRLDFIDDITEAENRKIYVYHLAKKLAIWDRTMTLNILE